MSAKTNILERLRAGQPNRRVPKPASLPDAALFVDYPEKNPVAMIEQFEQRFTALRGEFFLVKNCKHAAGTILHLLQSKEDGGCLADDSDLIQELFAENGHLATSFSRQAISALSSPVMSDYAVGLTQADVLVARTGSIVLRSTTAGGRRASVLPPLHIVVAYANQLVPSLDAVFSGPFRDGDWSYGTIITGPSRTADIEKILVLGAHGPKRLAVVLIG